MTGQISSISSSSATSSTSTSSSAKKLTEETKKKLQDLGVDTTSITTEAQGQIALLQALQQAQNREQAHHSGEKNEEMQSLKSAAISLASQVGVSVSSTDKLPDILSNIANAINNIQSQAGTDQTKLEQAQGYQNQLDAINASLANMQAQKQAAQAKISGSMEGLASQNKLYHKIS